MTEWRAVKCPDCDKIIGTRGKKQFRCSVCKRQYSIEPNLASKTEAEGLLKMEIGEEETEEDEEIEEEEQIESVGVKEEVEEKSESELKTMEVSKMAEESVESAGVGFGRVKCSECGAVVPAEAKFCAECGEEFEE